MFTICKTHIKKQLFSYWLSRYFTVKKYFGKQNILYKFKYDVSFEEHDLINIIQKYEHKILHSDYVEARRLKLGYKQNAIVMAKKLAEEEKNKYHLQCLEPLPLSLKYLSNSNASEINDDKLKNIVEPCIETHFPFEIKKMKIDNNIESLTNHDNHEYNNLIDVEIKQRLKYLNANNWMTDYDNYTDEEIQIDNWKINYGTPDPNSKISNIPCGGCGALLHCKDTAIPGYIPSEIYKNHNKEGGISLQALICQRCYFLKNYSLALQVQVSPQQYPKVLKAIQKKRKALVILIVDLLDFPCSIWPGAVDLLGPGRPIFLVGNKVDLLPQDGKRFLERVAEHLKNSAKESGFATTDIKHVALVSAITGFGVEDLITKLHSYWDYKGDVFLIGCTNVGKSSLFNALLQSDYCKSQAVDLIQRATVSPWPGTTLNLLKFPILRLSGHKSYLRYKRLLETNKQISEENKLRKIQLRTTKNPKYATLVGHIGRSFSSADINGFGDLFSIKRHANSAEKVGINENDEEYALSKWCYDTPGVIQPEQLLHLLTTEELVLTLPKQLLRPQTFCLQPNSSIFIGGLSRLDYLEGESFARFTVFCSSSLPITICKTDVAQELYEQFLGTKVFGVPTGSLERLKLWPGLKRTKDFTLTGIDWNYSCADIVLSSSGWISVAGGSKLKYKIQAWVPENCGIHLRNSLLPNAVALRGKRIRYSPAYRNNKYYFDK